MRGRSRSPKAKASTTLRRWRPPSWKRSKCERRSATTCRCGARQRLELRHEGSAVDTVDILLSKGARPIGDDEEVDWLEGEDLMTGQSVFVPNDVVKFSLDPATARYWQTSDGLASGNTIWESVFHGLCERVERDASTLWLLRSDAEIMERCVDPQSFEDPVVDELSRRVDRAGLQLRLFDASCDTRLPIYGAFLSPVADGCETNWKHFDLSSGWGCHPAPVRAALRAITEAAQTRLTTISAARDDFDPSATMSPFTPRCSSIRARSRSFWRRPAMRTSSGKIICR